MYSSKNDSLLFQIKGITSFSLSSTVILKFFDFICFCASLRGFSLLVTFLNSFSNTSFLNTLFNSFALTDFS